MSIFKYLSPIALGSKLSGPKGDPNGAAAAYLNQIPQLAQNQLNPYIQQGQQAGSAAQGQYAQMAQNPRSVYDDIIAGYSPSKGYEFRRDQAQKSLTNTAAAGGYRGTQNDQIAQADLLNKLLGQDQQEYLSNVLGIQGSGLAGQEIGAQRGFEANSALTDILGNNLSARGSLAFQGEQQKNANRAQMMRLIAQVLGAGAGAAIGGPAGAQAGSAIGGSIAGATAPAPGAYSYPGGSKNQMYGGGNF